MLKIITERTRPAGPDEWPALIVTMIEDSAELDDPNKELLFYVNQADKETVVGEYQAVRIKHPKRLKKAVKIDSISTIGAKYTASHSQRCRSLRAGTEHPYRMILFCQVLHTTDELRHQT